MMSGAVAVCIGTPFDVALVRMQSDSMRPVPERRNYKNVFDAIIRMIREEGPSRLYSGLMPNVLRGMSMNAGMLACYDHAKEMISEHITHDAASMNTQIGASLVAGFCAAAFSLPFDMIKSRLRKYIPLKDLPIVLFFFQNNPHFLFYISLYIIYRLIHM